MKSIKRITTWILLTGLLLISFQRCKKGILEEGNQLKKARISTVVTDADGNIYNTIKIGTQIWMTENLKTTKLNDGTAIPYRVGTGASGYCWYNNEENNKDVYGALYSWAPVATRKLAPKGWHVPDRSDWQILINYLGSNAAYKLMETGTTHWSAPNFQATNESGFTAIPGGRVTYRLFVFEGIGSIATWWVSNHGGTSNPMYMILQGGEINTETSFSGDFISVRCLKDDLPVLSTLPLSKITSTSVTTGGDITNVGGLKITSCGVCWHTSPNPTMKNSKTVDEPYNNPDYLDPAMGIGKFTSIITGLKAGKTYYIRAYATNSLGTAYGNEITFSMPAN